MTDRAFPRPIVDPVPADSAGTVEIGFAVPERYNASQILFDNLAQGHGDRVAVAGPGGQRSYAELCADAGRFGNALLSLGLQRGDRVLMFLDDTPAYPAAFFGAVRAGLVPLLINLQTPPDLLQFYLADSGATVAITEAAFAETFDAAACKNTRLKTLIAVNGTAHADVAADLIAAEAHNVGDTLCSNEPNLRKMPPDRIDQLCTLSDEKVAGAVNNKEGLLLIALDRHVAHRGAAHGFADGRGIGCVVLAPSDIRLHVLRRNQPDIVPEFAKFAPPEVRRRAGFHPNKASRQLGEIDEHFTPPETALLNDAAERVYAVNLEDMLGEIEADRVIFIVDGSCPSDLTAVTLARSCR